MTLTIKEQALASKQKKIKSLSNSKSSQNDRSRSPAARNHSDQMTNGTNSNNNSTTTAETGSAAQVPKIYSIHPNNYTSQDPRDYIFFCSQSQKPWGVFSNFHKEKIPHVGLDGKTFWCVEQEMMYAKAITFEGADSETAKRIMSETHPGHIRQMGREVKNYDNEIWDKVRYGFVLNAIRQKFREYGDEGDSTGSNSSSSNSVSKQTQSKNTNSTKKTVAVKTNPLRDTLKKSGSKIIVEAAWYDNIWGVGLPEWKSQGRNGYSGIRDPNAPEDQFEKPPKEWNGTNLLGRCLMQIREEILEQGS